MTGTFVVIPAFNEARTIRGVVSAVLAEPVDALIVVDDGSIDDTASQISDLGLSPRLELLQHQVNLGKGFALAAGLHRALELGAQQIITFDADGQHHAGDIPRMQAQASQAPQSIIIAARAKGRGRAPALRRFANETADFWISWACGRRIADTQSGFRLYPAAILARLRTRPRDNQGFAYETELLIDAVEAGAGIRAVPIETLYHDDSRPSHYRPWSDTWSIIRLVGGRLLRGGMYPTRLLRAQGWLNT